jgi:hypothetical protein
VRDDADRHVAVDARAGVLDQVAAQDVDGLAHQVDATDEAQEEQGRVEQRGRRGAGVDLALEALDSARLSLAATLTVCVYQ